MAWVSLVALFVAASAVNFDVHLDARNNGAYTARPGASMDNAAHSIYGGLYSQLLFGESFEEATAAAESGPWWNGVLPRNLLFVFFSQVSG